MPAHHTCLLRNLYAGQEATVSTLHGTTDWFKLGKERDKAIYCHPVKVSASNAGDLGSIPGSGKSPEEGNGNQLQYSCLGNPMERGAWWVAKSRTRLSDFTLFYLTYMQSISWEMPG